MKRIFAVFVILSIFSSGIFGKPSGGCPRCATDYAPVCAKHANGDVQTFRNGCILWSHNCYIEEKDYYNQISEGVCPGMTYDE
uniref:Putative secreted protein n=1 Tax=Nyssomyia neivai TaxID=330878 RepID=A0A1L8DNE7_9DIPT